MPRVSTLRFWIAASALLVGLTFLLSASPAFGKSKEQAKREAKECNDEYNRERKRSLALQGLTQGQKQARIDRAYDDLVACMKNKGLLAMVPKKPVLEKGPASRRPQGAAAETAPATKPKVQKKSQWVSPGPRQTGSNLP